MTKTIAKDIIDRFNNSDNLSKEDETLFIEACNFLIETEEDDEVMVNLGGYYYDKKRFDLAEKYYLMAHEKGNKWAPDGLGYIYYYGRNGERNFEKAFYYFSLAAKNGNLEAEMKIADMYKNGYGVKQDKEKYKALLLNLFYKVKDTNKLFDPYPEVAHRLADIYIAEGKEDEARKILLKANSFIEQRIRYNPFWGNLIICKRIKQLLYKVYDFDEEFMNIFDLFYLFQKPHKVVLYYGGNKYLIDAFLDNDEIRVKMGDKVYKSVEDFILNALIKNKHLYVLHYEDIYTLEFIK